MRAAMFKEVNLDDLDKYPVEPSELTPMQNLLANVRIAIKTSPWLNFLDDRDKLLKQRIDSINEIKIVIIDILNKQLDGRKRIKVSIPRYVEPILEDVLSSTEFLGYRKTRIKEDRDYILSFPDMPIVVLFEVI